MNPGVRFVLGATLFGVGVAFGILRFLLGWYAPNAAIDGGFLLILALVGPGIYLMGTGVDGMRNR